MPLPLQEASSVGGTQATAAPRILLSVGLGIASTKTCGHSLQDLAVEIGKKGPERQRQTTYQILVEKACRRHLLGQSHREDLSRILALQGHHTAHRNTENLAESHG